MGTIVSLVNGFGFTWIYRDWIYSWLPMRFMVEGLRNLFYFGDGMTWSTPVSVLVWIGLVSMIVILASAFKYTKVKKEILDRDIV